MTRLAGLQGNILRGYETNHAHYLFARVNDAAATRAWLARQIDRVTTDRGWGTDSATSTTFNLAFTHAGLLALGVPAARFERDSAFAAGMAARAEQIGDAQGSAPGDWVTGLREAHLLAVVTATAAELLDVAVARLRDSLGSAGLGIAHEQQAHTLPDGREHFGFGDGFSQPAVVGAESGPREGEGTLTPLRRWRKLALGEFVLGHRDEGGLPSRGPSGPLGEDASYAVVRKLEQDVAAFRRYLAEAARRFGRDPDWISAKMVGRWQNGSSLARYPTAPGPAAADDRKANRFGYHRDRDGHACPLGAHVRRANPRDALGWQGRLTSRHRIIRRGMSYGPRLPACAVEPDGRERGLMFVCYQANIERQFEFIQRQWLGDGNPFGLGGHTDPLLQGGQFVVQGTAPLWLDGLPKFVTTRGGDYFLVPGIAGLRALAAGGC
jgi:Dyp-type peroxidase family